MARHSNEQDAEMYKNSQPLPTQMNPTLFDGRVVSAAAGKMHSAVVTDKGTLYTWGTMHGTAQETSREMPTIVDPPCTRFFEEGLRIGPCHDLLPSKAIAFAMGTHQRLGGGAWPCGLNGSFMHAQQAYAPRKSLRQQGKSPALSTDRPCLYLTMPYDLVQRVVEMCALGPQGPAGKTEGILRLLGGGHMRY